MKILSATQAKKVDQYTIAHEPIAAIDLMERASQRMVDWIVQHLPANQSYLIFAGPGNNGGDALAVARLLNETAHPAAIQVITCFYEKTVSEECHTNLARLGNQSGIQITDVEKLARIPTADYILDGIFGIGLSRPILDPFEDLILQINASKSKVIAIDIPSGMLADSASIGSIIQADITLSLGCPKVALFLPESYPYVGTWFTIDIGLHEAGVRDQDSSFATLENITAQQLYKPRLKFNHKGTNGSALLVCGSAKMTGAAVLAAQGALRSGVGKLHIHSVSAAIKTCRLLIPEAICYADKYPDRITKIPIHPREFNAIGIGCGIGTVIVTRDAISDVLRKSSYPVVLDADALNIISKNRSLLKLMPQNSILTPHPKEFQRLFGETINSFDRLDRLRTMATTHQVHIILKGAHSVIALSNGQLFFNMTGNPGMATAGSGDVLTGILTALLAQGYPSSDAALLGTYVHGLAGDLAFKEKGSYEGIIASDLVDHLPQAFGTFYKDQ